METSFEIVLGVLKNKQNGVLVCQRKKSDSLGGLWELPGGKKKPGEVMIEALKRELKEELGISVFSARPLIRLDFLDEGRRFILNVFDVIKWIGTPTGKEGQKTFWAREDKLHDYSFPKFNPSINTAISLPSIISVTPPLEEFDEYIQEVVRIAKSGVDLIQIRPLVSNKDLLIKIGKSLSSRINLKKTTLMINCKQSEFDPKLFGGLHLNRLEASRCYYRPISKSQLLSTSCHNLKELAQAEKIGVDFVYMSPVKSSITHSDRPPLGWNTLKKFVRKSSVPVYALGGLSFNDIISAKWLGCQGIALKSAIWDNKEKKNSLRAFEQMKTHLDRI